MNLKGYLNILNSVWNFQPIVVGVEITNRCNLNCSHCYWQKKKKCDELPDDEMISFLENLANNGMVLCILSGGEPVLRPTIIQKAVKIFLNTIVFTNGTLGFPYRPTFWALSIDGTKEIHDKIRGKGVYDRIMNNLSEAKSPIIVTTTISQLNYRYIEEFIRDLVDKNEIKAIVFNFYTPPKNQSDDTHFLPVSSRGKIINEILKYRKEYGDKILATKEGGYFFMEGGGLEEWNSFDKCWIQRMTKGYNSDGSSIKGCIFGNDIDCSKCGCSLSPMFLSTMKGSGKGKSIFFKFPKLILTWDIAMMLYKTMLHFRKFPESSKYYFPLDYFRVSSPFEDIRQTIYEIFRRTKKLISMNK